MFAASPASSLHSAASVPGGSASFSSQHNPLAAPIDRVQALASSPSGHSAHSAQHAAGGGFGVGRNSGGGGSSVASGGAGAGAAASSAPVQLRDPAELVQRATADSLSGVSDWALNMRVVDLVNNSPDKAEYILQSLMPRLLSKDHAVGLTALALLEALVKNCPPTHALVGRRAVLDPLVQLLPVRIRDPEHKHPFSADHTNDVLGMERYDRILVVVQLWGKSFAYNARAPAFMEVYKELLGRGVKFAQPDRDELAPVFTPPPNSKLLADRVAGIASSRTSRQGSLSNLHSANASSAPSPASSAPHSARSSINGASVSQAASSAASSSSSSSSPSSLSDPPLIYTTPPSFRDAELSGAWEQVKLLLEILDNSDTAEAVAQDDIANMLVKDLRKAQESLLAKLQRPTVNDRVDQLLACNDILVNTFAYYDGLSKGTMRRRNAQDEARRAAAEEDLVFAERPHVRRANSFNMEDHDIRLVRDSQNPQEAPHQYSSEANQSSFSYAVPALQPSPAHARSPSAGESSALFAASSQQPQQRSQPQPIATSAPTAPPMQVRGERSPTRPQSTQPAAYSPEPYRMEGSRPPSHAVSAHSGSGSGSGSAAGQQQTHSATVPHQSRSPSSLTPTTRATQQPQQPASAPTGAPAAASALPAAQPSQQPNASAATPSVASQPLQPAMPSMPQGAPGSFPFPAAGAGGSQPAMSPEQYAQWMAFMQQQMAMMHQAMMQQQQQQQTQPAAQAVQQGEAGGEAPHGLGEQGEQAQGERGDDVNTQLGQMNLDGQRR